MERRDRERRRGREGEDEREWRRGRVGAKRRMEGGVTTRWRRWPTVSRESL
ncbi:hypothetical protein TIFTF001_015264 [Ficus carica]|uniref:Uncharacterized protein n=1 Tax=Ficus carica TaxID=3494 RepID=A0AA88D6D8_FICCA|nr:hypothetical protein TIFTF001_015264 [Ficus carica]